jgi:hypothetical protein
LFLPKQEFPRILHKTKAGILPELGRIGKDVIEIKKLLLSGFRSPN